MTKEEMEAEAKKKADAEAEQARKDAESGNIDKILKCVDSIMGRLDAMDEERKADRSRMDAVEEAVADKRKDAEEEEKKADAEDEEKKKADAEAEAKKKADAEEEEAKKADALNAAALDKRIAEAVAARTPQLSDEDTAKYADAQARADDVYQALGSTAPRALAGETLIAYRRRLATKLQPHSKAWKDVDLLKINDSAAFDVAEGQIMADALAAAISPVGVAEDMLREVTRRDSTGRQITTFYGNFKAGMGDFMLPSKYLTAITKPNA